MHTPSGDVEDGGDTDCSYFYFLWGKTAEREKRYDEAIEAYEKAIVCDPEADFVMRRLVVLLIRQNRQLQARAWIEKLVARRPEDLKTKMVLARLYGATGEVKKAEKTYLQIIQQSPEHTEAMLMLGAFYISAKQYEKAEKILEQATQQDPNSAGAYQYLARLYRELGLSNKALDAYEAALNIHWQAPLALETALLYEEEHRLEEAEKLYKKILETDAANENAVGRLVRIYVEEGKNNEALGVLQELRKYAFDTRKVDFSIGRVLMQQKKYDAAIELFSKMLELYPDFDVARTIIALAYYEKGDRTEAKRRLMEIPRDSSGYEDAFTLLMKIMGEGGEYDQAIALINEIMERGDFPAVVELYPVLATLYKEKGDLQGARAAYLQAIEQYPDEPSLHFEYAMFLDGTGDQEKALEVAAKVLEIEPENPLALNYLGYTWAERGENLEQALSYVQQALTLRPQDGFIQDSLGWVLYKLDRIDEAIEALEKAVAIEADDPTISEHLGDAYLQGKKLQRALELYKTSLQLQRSEEGSARLEKKIEALQ